MCVPDRRTRTRNALRVLGTNDFTPERADPMKAVLNGTVLAEADAGVLVVMVVSSPGFVETFLVGN